MSLVNVMYQTSLDQFQTLFDKSMDAAEKASLASKRVNNIIDTLTLNVYNYATTGLFERHKLLFSFQMTAKLQEAKGEMDAAELDFFVKGNLSLEKSARGKPHAWIPNQGWEDIMKLSEVCPDVFAKLPDDVDKKGADWKEWFELCPLQKNTSLLRAVPVQHSTDAPADPCSNAAEDQRKGAG